MVSAGQPPPPHATAHTLHHALGNLGGRQKDWIVLPSHAQLLTQPTTIPVPPTKRRGRPRKAPVENQTPTQAVDPTLLSTSTRQPEHQQAFVSSSQLPNTAASAPGLPTVLPSQTPSESVASAAAPAQVPAPWPANSGNALTPEIIPEQVNINTVHFEPVRQNSTDGQVQQARVRSHLPPNNPVQTSSSPVLRQNPSALNQTSGQAPVLNQPTDIQLHALGPNRTAAPSYSRPGLRPAWYTKQDCLDALQRFQSSIPASPAHASDRMRMAVLRDAVDRQDWAYLTMHQYYCMLTTCPANLPHSLTNAPTLPHALRLLHDVLQPNHTLSPTVLYFFSHFPFPLQTIRATWGPIFEQQMHLFSLFVSRSSNYEQLRQICDQRRYPPLARELSTTLGIGSVTFQRLVFTAFYRHICRWIPLKPALKHFEAQALAIFQQNQAICLESRFGSASVQSQEEITLNQVAGRQLREIIEQYGIALRELGLPSASPYQQHRPHQPQGNFVLPSSLNSQMSHLPSQPVVHRFTGLANAPSTPVNPNILPQPATTRAAPPAESHNKSQTSLLPPSGRKQPQQRVPNPSRFSLHQANLRSPVLCAPSGSPSLYTFHDGYVKPPTRLSEPGRTIETWTFAMSREEMQVLCKTARQPMGAPGTRNINENSKLASLRCIKWNQGVEMPKEHAWATTETSWIPYLYISLNDTPLQARKKLHHGKDLPIDVTDLLCEGENVLKMTVMADSGDASHLNYLIAIEAIGVVAHESIKHRCLSQGRVSAEEVLQGIKTKLSGSDGDDEISIVESNMTIGLREPFSQAKMCDIPVRSRACLHNDCFDLDIFLQSRARKGDASVADQWKCPICGVDARPYTLLHDGFMELVKQQLEAQGLADTRHIVVQQDGSWKPKPEAAESGTGAREGSAGRAPTPVSARASVSRRSSMVANVEVIDLSD
ncbi:uncharacterized protein yc1106_06558 [Curvularia clavata]|uniref:SP-RING-type domain-containing protein n=1 Tax=Curvularia clavata TaxID=95742 RepID=A0A9Q9DUY6_CURCL|nr:uncharacterized protein yc1106_06558 [Curvularia clavata]